MEYLNKEGLTKLISLIKSALSGKVDTSDSRLSNARPASDVYSWAKQASKPSYSSSEISGLGNLATKSTNGSTANFLRGDGSWVTPPNTDTHKTWGLSISGHTVTIVDGGSNKSVTVPDADTNTWRGITDSYSGTSTSVSLSQKGANDLYNALHGSMTGAISTTWIDQNLT